MNIVIAKNYALFIITEYIFIEYTVTQILSIIFDNKVLECEM